MALTAKSLLFHSFIQPFSSSYQKGSEYYLQGENQIPLTQISFHYLLYR